MTVDRYLAHADPIIRQFARRESYRGHGGIRPPTDEDVPLKGWLEQHLGERAVIS